MGRLFGTDGVRGQANSELTAELALDLSVAAAHVLAETGAFGTHPVALKLHRDVTVPLKVQVVKEGAQASTAAPAPAPAEKTE